MSDYVTDKDIRAWDILRGSDLKYTKPKKKEPAPRKEKQIAPEQAHLPTKAEYKKRVSTINMASATQKALKVVQNKLGYDLSASGHYTERFKRNLGWHTFCRCIQLICPSFTLSGIHAALTVPNAPSKTTLPYMFQCSRENPHSDEDLKRLLQE
jgi:hypothetical protein